MSDIEYLYDENNQAPYPEDLNSNENNEQIPQDIEAIRDDVDDTMNPDKEEEIINNKFLSLKRNNEVNNLEDSYNQKYESIIKNKITIISI